MKKVWTAKDVEFLQMIAQEPVSISTPIGTGDTDQDTELGDMLPDTQPGPEELASINIRNELLNNIIKEYLDPREQIVITMRYGLLTGKTMTLEEVGEKFGVTRERIRQVENKALRRLRHALVVRKHLSLGDIL